MLSRIQLIRNIGQFDSVNGGSAIALTKLALIYPENGRGKTTLSAILRSLGAGNPTPTQIAERKRLSAAHDPHVVMQPASGGTLQFQNGAWTQTLPNLAVFDDVSRGMCGRPAGFKWTAGRFGGGSTAVMCPAA